MHTHLSKEQRVGIQYWREQIEYTNSNESLLKQYAVYIPL